MIVVLIVFGRSGTSIHDILRTKILPNQLRFNKLGKKNSWYLRVISE
uniref:Uncharacterized protein n=1 Tax=Myoviridae sp. ctfJc17 TaxID=2827612 RepID=A0A8S5LQX5_9CAUD|nr:MAG TPA: hypothetical protein [Myoviridae sp. ctfJc17]